MSIVKDRFSSSVRDTFNEEENKMHLAVSEWQEPSVDTWSPLADGILNSATFQCWHGRRNENWMICFVGAPGSAKTTLSALATRKLRDLYSGDMEAVASVFVREDVTSGSAVEEVLHSIFQQLAIGFNKSDTSEEHLTKYRNYLESWSQGSRSDIHIQILRDAIHLCLAQLSRAFLVIDDCDSCNAKASLLLANELSQMAEKGLKVFLTSRVPSLKKPPRIVTCDSCPKGGTDIIVYWKCKRCEDRGIEPGEVHVQCQVCRDAGKPCSYCQNSGHFVQPFDHVEINLNHNVYINRYIEWDLEREHGDLGLHSGNHDLPPYSGLGRRLVQSQDHIALEKLLEVVGRQAEMNITLARLRLENIHRADPTDVLRPTVADVLPANIVGFFDAGMKCIEEQPPAQRILGLRIVATVTNFDFDDHILIFEVMDGILRDAEKGSGRHPAEGMRSAPAAGMSTNFAPEEERPEANVRRQRLREILYAARGFVVVEPEANYPMKAYCETFHTYARENYNETLMQARESLDFRRIEFDAYGLGRFVESSS